MSEPCEVCRGREIITVPVYRPVAAPANAVIENIAVESSYREFPCPACAKWAETDRVKVMQAHCIMSVHLKDDPNAVAYARRHAAYQLVDELLKGDSFLRLDKQSAPAKFSSQYEPQSICYQVTIGVVSKHVVASLDERVARHQDALAKEVLNEAEAQIRNWGSQYGQEGINKVRAIELIGGALTTVLNRRKAKEA